MVDLCGTAMRSVLSTFYEYLTLSKQCTTEILFTFDDFTIHLPVKVEVARQFHGLLVTYK